MLGGEKISVPPTLLFSLLGNHHDVRKAVSSDFKRPGDVIFLVGQTHQELGASELSFMLRDEGIGGIGGAVPEIDPVRNMSAYRALTAAMREELVASAHDCSDGGLAVALAECCFGSDSGATVDITPLWSDCDHLDLWGALFGESLGRILVSIRPDDRDAFEASMEGVCCHYIGDVSEGDGISVIMDGGVVLTASMSEMRDSWKGTLHGGGA
jgi:phosphoribosylformylglycinamidine synthase